MRNCIPPEKVLAIGLYRLAHGNSYVSLAPVFNVGKSTAIEAVQDVVNVHEVTFAVLRKSNF